MPTQFLHKSFLGNDVLSYLIATGLFLLGLLVVWVFKWVVLKRMERWAASTKTKTDDFLIASFRKSLVPLLYYGALYFALRSLTLNPSIAKAMSVLGTVLVTVAAVRFILAAGQFVLFEVWLTKRPDAANLERQLRTSMPVISVVVWMLGIIFLLDNMGFKISTLVAGLGIGGVALALASQTVLADTFSYFAIMLDRPFELDDFIITGDFMGTVEHIGIKTTRLRSLGGEQLVFSNKDLTDSRLRNYKRMQIRRVEFKVGVTYDTSIEKLKKAVEILRDIITKTPDARLDRAHFASYEDSSLVFDVVYFVSSADYNKYMDVQQSINLEIKRSFEAEKIEFAFPTRTLYVAGTPPAHT